MIGDGHMDSLNNEIRTLVEKEVDNILKKPRKMEDSIRLTLSVQGIEPNLETVLSYITGLILGRVLQVYVSIYNREITHNEMNELIQLLKRRAFELRQTFISTRIE